MKRGLLADKTLGTFVVIAVQACAKISALATERVSLTIIANATPASMESQSGPVLIAHCAHALRILLGLER